MKQKTVPTKVLGVTVRADEKTVKSYNEAVDELRESLARLWEAILVAAGLRKP